MAGSKVMPLAAVPGKATAASKSQQQRPAPRAADQHSSPPTLVSRGTQLATAAVAVAGRLLRSRRFRQQVTWAVIAVLSAVFIWLHVRHQPLSPEACRQVTRQFNISAVMAGLRHQSTLAATAAAAAAAANKAPQDKLHIVTIISSHTPIEKVHASPLFKGLPPDQRHLVTVLRSSTRMGHALDGLGAFGAKIIELYKFVSQPSIAPGDLVLLTDALDVVMDHNYIKDIPAKFAAITSAPITRNPSTTTLRISSTTSTTTLRLGGGGSSGEAGVKYSNHRKAHAVHPKRGNNSSSHSHNRVRSTRNRTSSSSVTAPELRLLFAAEKWPWPDFRRWSCFTDSKPPYKYLNAGGLIGHAGYIKALLEPSMHQITKWVDDQRWYNTAYLALREHRGIFLDSNCEIFQTMPGVEVDGRDLQFDIHSKRWYNALTKTYPVLLHGNGNSKPIFFGKVVPRLSVEWSWNNDNSTSVAAAAD